jgi:hypothetical protein
LDTQARSQGNIKMCLLEVEWEAWTGLIWVRIGTGGCSVVNAVLKLLVSQSAGNFLTSLGLVTFSRRNLLLRVS